jgi:hypothetical protein
VGSEEVVETLPNSSRGGKAVANVGAAIRAGSGLSATAATADDSLPASLKTRVNVFNTSRVVLTACPLLEGCSDTIAAFRMARLSEAALSRN